MKIDIIFFTQKGEAICEKIYNSLTEDSHTVSKATGFGKSGKIDVYEWTQSNFESSDILVFIGAVGIAVRAAAPHIRSKMSDPAVIVIDDTARYVIPVLSGHIGGANDAAIHMARLLGSQAVITTATDNNRVFAIDMWAKKNDIEIVNCKCIKNVSSKLLKGEEITLKSDFEIEGDLPKGIKMCEGERADIYITYKNKRGLFAGDTLILAPKVLVLGIGSRRDISDINVEKAFTEVLRIYEVFERSFYAVASIDLKSDEAGILDFCLKYKLDFTTYSAEELNETDGAFSSSEFVKNISGTDCVCERSAVRRSCGSLIMKKRKIDGVTLAIGLKEYKVKF